MDTLLKQAGNRRSLNKYLYRRHQLLRHHEEYIDNPGGCNSCTQVCKSFPETVLGAVYYDKSYSDSLPTLYAGYWYWFDVQIKDRTRLENLGFCRSETLDQVDGKRFFAFVRDRFGPHEEAMFIEPIEGGLLEVRMKWIQRARLCLHIDPEPVETPGY